MTSKATLPNCHECGRFTTEQQLLLECWLTLGRRTVWDGEQVMWAGGVGVLEDVMRKMAIRWEANGRTYEQQ